jgi:hypothetical protein
MTKKSHAVLGIHIAVLLFGLAGLFGKLLVLSPLVIVFGRTFFASITLGIIIFYSLKNSTPNAVQKRSDCSYFTRPHTGYTLDHFLSLNSNLNCGRGTSLILHISVVRHLSGAVFL